MIVIGIGGFLGALTRFYLGKLSVHSYPWATFFINITGSFALGFLFAFEPSEWIWHFIGLGFLGAYTTFSTFGFECLQLLEQKKWKQTIIYICTTVLCGLLFATLGFSLV
ncbi:fluoride efflux transporter CrcB [Lysinibacillus sp. Bpr_S20]|uniref:fluoride efflux transporter CrcB n=1 Tax=Lysinibacillus sp. Bpr_S20 TaxID=2933964 RepID=UPI002011C214|nr:fluoride efflux transporter CrcB [Lysinibacillus sp. Bpr_S20]MCL1703478.1 fluoride efflux transporter CrcB [Lysinibacillus sp. Bpr_S20]